MVKMSRKVGRITDIGIYLTPGVIPGRGILISSTITAKTSWSPLGLAESETCPLLVHTNHY